jgi:hypothetical protein
MGGGGGGAKDGGTAARSQWTTATAMGNCGLRRVLGAQWLKAAARATAEAAGAGVKRGCLL